MCQCKSGCTSRRCACLKRGKSCTEDCRCQPCQNPLNGLDAEDFPMCLIQNIQAYQALSQAQLDEPYALPCEHAELPLKTLLMGFFVEDCSTGATLGGGKGATLCDGCSFG